LRLPFTPGPRSEPSDRRTPPASPPGRDRPPPPGPGGVPLGPETNPAELGPLRPGGRLGTGGGPGEGGPGEGPGGSGGPHDGGPHDLPGCPGRREVRPGGGGQRHRRQADPPPPSCFRGHESQGRRRSPGEMGGDQKTGEGGEARKRPVRPLGGSAGHAGPSSRAPHGGKGLPARFRLARRPFLPGQDQGGDRRGGGRIAQRGKRRVGKALPGNRRSPLRRGQRGPPAWGQPGDGPEGHPGPVRYPLPPHGKGPGKTHEGRHRA